MTNEEYARHIAEQWNVKESGAAVVRAHLATTAYGSDALAGRKEIRIITLSGPKTVRGRKGALKLGNSELTDEKHASNGVLWTIGALVKD